MRSNQEKLKDRLMLKKIQKEIDTAVYWNFGHSPNDERFDKLLQQREDILSRQKGG